MGNPCRVVIVIFSVFNNRLKTKPFAHLESTLSNK